MKTTRGKHTVDEILEMYGRGFTTRQIASLNDTGRGSICAILRRHGHRVGQIGQFKKGDRIKGRLSRDEIIHLYSVAKEPTSKIAKLDGTTPAIINRLLRKAKVKMWPQGIYTSSSYRAISNRLKIPVDTFIRLKAIAKLGARCTQCGQTDPRVLQINHLVEKTGILRVKEFMQIIRHGSSSHDVRCANCNILYEYERGRRVAISNDIFDKMCLTLPELLAKPSHGH